MIEARGGLAGPEYRALPDPARQAVREEVEQAVAPRRGPGGLARAVEARLATARR